jgi:hypothetical protein
MIVNVLRDEEAMPTVKRTFAAFRDYLAAARDTLMIGRRARGQDGRRLVAAVGHALAFPTWRSLVREQGLDDRQAAELMCRLIAAAADERRSR